MVTRTLVNEFCNKSCFLQEQHLFLFFFFFGKNELAALGQAGFVVDGVFWRGESVGVGGGHPEFLLQELVVLMDGGRVTCLDFTAL